MQNHDKKTIERAIRDYIDEPTGDNIYSSREVEDIITELEYKNVISFESYPLKNNTFALSIYVYPPNDKQKGFELIFTNFEAKSGQTSSIEMLAINLAEFEKQAQTTAKLFNNNN